MTKLKNNKEVELEEMKEILAEKQKLLDEKKQFEKISEELRQAEQELTGLLQTREKKIHDLEIQLAAIATSEQHYSKQVKELKTELENEKFKNAELTVSCNKLSQEKKELAQEASDMALEIKKHQEDIKNSRKQEERMLKQIENLEETETQLRNELESVKEELKQKGDEVKCKLDKSEENARSIECEVVKKDKQMKILENKCNSLRKQIENKSKFIEELQQENKAFKKKNTADSKQLNVYEIKEKLKREAKENIVTLKGKKDKEDKKTQTSLVETPETGYWKFDSKAAPSQNRSRNFSSAHHGKSKDNGDYLWTSAKNTLSTPLPKAYTVKTPTKSQIQQRENKNVPMEESNKKRKMVFEFDINSDSSETTDLLSMVSEEDTLKKLYKNNNPPISHLCVRTPKKTPSSLTTPGSTLKFGAMRKMREDRWAVIAKMDRKQKLKEAEKLFV